MASGNVDLIRPIYEEWGRGNWRQHFDVYHPRMEWGWSDEFPGYHGRGRGSGVEIHQQGAHVFRLRDGKVVRLEIFASRERAIASVSGDPVRPRGDHAAG